MFDKRAHLPDCTLEIRFHRRGREMSPPSNKSMDCNLASTSSNLVTATSSTFAIRLSASLNLTFKERIAVFWLSCMHMPLRVAMISSRPTMVNGARSRSWPKTSLRAAEVPVQAARAQEVETDTYLTLAVTRNGEDLRARRGLAHATYLPGTWKWCGAYACQLSMCADFRLAKNRATPQFSMNKHRATNQSLGARDNGYFDHQGTTPAAQRPHNRDDDLLDSPSAGKLASFATLVEQPIHRVFRPPSTSLTDGGTHALWHVNNRSVASPYPSCNDSRKNLGQECRLRYEIALLA